MITTKQQLLGTRAHSLFEIMELLTVYAEELEEKNCKREGEKLRSIATEVEDMALILMGKAHRNA